MGIATTMNIYGYEHLLYIIVWIDELVQGVAEGCGLNHVRIADTSQLHFHTSLFSVATLNNQRLLTPKEWMNQDNDQVCGYMPNWLVALSVPDLDHILGRSAFHDISKGKMWELPQAQKTYCHVKAPWVPQNLDVPKWSKMNQNEGLPTLELEILRS